MAQEGKVVMASRWWPLLAGSSIKTGPRYYTLMLLVVMMMMMMMMMMRAKNLRASFNQQASKLAS